MYNAESVHDAAFWGGNPLVWCPVWGRRETPSLWCHCISTVIWEPEALLEQTIPLSWVTLKKKSIKKMPFCFPLYPACESLRRSGGSQHQSGTLSMALNWPLLHQGSPGTCRWCSGCCLYEADTQIKQEPATHLVPNFSRKRLVRLYVGYFCTSFSSLMLDLMGQSACESERDWKHQWIYSIYRLSLQEWPAGLF